MACITIRSKDTLTNITDDPSQANTVAQVALDALGRMLGITQGGMLWRDLPHKSEENSQDSVTEPDDQTSRSTESPNLGE